MTKHQTTRDCGNRTFIDHGAEKSAFSPVNGTYLARNPSFLGAAVPTWKENGLFLRRHIKEIRDF